jgi:HSP20 family molecular chaperone IbpA
VSAASDPLVATRIAAELEPTAHVHNGPAEYRIDVEAPGLGVDDFSVHLAGRLLRITGPSLSTLGADRDFEFLFRLPDQVAGGGVVASFEDGKLVVRAPFEASEGRTIDIEAPGPSR